jgi:hypothetical protein
MASNGAAANSGQSLSAFANPHVRSKLRVKKLEVHEV